MGRILALLVFLGVASLLGFLEWRGARHAGRERPPASIPVTAADTDPDAVLDLHWMGPPFFPSGREGLWVETMLEERFRWRITPQFLDPSGFERKRPLQLSSGAIPDVFVEADPLMLRKAVHQRFVAEIPYALVRRLAPAYFERVLEKAPHAWLGTRVDGRNYGLPSLTGTRRPIPGIWRADWLRQGGFERAPETLAEMEAAFRFFAHGDPDGNGKADTWGMTGDVTHWWWVSFSEIFGAFGVIPYDWMELDGRVTWGALHPGTREALALLRRWHAEGLIHPDFLTDNAHPGQSVEKKFLQGKTGYLFYKAQYHHLDLVEPSSFYRQLLDLQFGEAVRGGLVQRLAEGSEPPILVPGRLPAGPDGRRGARVWGNAGNLVVFGRRMAERPEAAARVLGMLEAMGTDRVLHVEAQAGRQGVHWDWRDPAVGQGSGVDLVPELKVRNASWRQVIGMGSTYWNLLGTVDAFSRYYGRREGVEFDDRWRLEEEGLVNVLGKSDVVPSASRYLGDLRVFQQTFFAEVIRGSRPLSDLDWFEDEWLARGGAVLTEEANALFAEREAILRALRAEGGAAGLARAGTSPGGAR